ncbi:MAG TPA: cyclic nucleotide-binding domain-containing protein [Nocardioidaceae bacterium]|nr:cyclic nucleotide-binding domain-containing protein [Nocardioidaceae bacterium]
MRLFSDSSDARLERLFALESLSGLSKKEVRQVIQAGTLVEVQVGHVLAEEDELADGSVYVVVSGSLNVVQSGEPIRTTSEGDLLGEIGTVAGLYRTATVTADTESELLHFPADAVAQLSADVPAFRAILERAAGKRLSRDRYTE